MKALDNKPTDEEIQAVTDAVSSFVIAMKNYALYPEKHVICQKSISNVRTRLNGFFKDHDFLRLNVEKDSLLFEREDVLQVRAEKEDLSSFLFRDGIQWLEFQQGITLNEISAFINLLNKYRDPQEEEAEGDLVTALWEMDISHLKYEAANVYWDNKPLVDLSLLNAGGPQPQNLEQQKGEQGVSEDDSSTAQKEEKQNPLINLPINKAGDDLWELTPEEGLELSQMVLEAESEDRTQDLLDVLLLVIDDQDNTKDLASVLGFLADDFKGSLVQGDFQFALKLLQSLAGTRRSYQTEKPWSLPVFERLFSIISGRQVLGLLSRVWPTLDSLDTDRIKSLRKFLLLLPPEAILALGPMLPQIRSSNIQKQLMGVIGVMAKKDLSPLEQLIDDCSDEFIAQKLVIILGHLEGDRPTQILLKMIRYSSILVRKEALKYLLDRDAKLLNKIFHVIDDPEKDIRCLLLDYLGSGRSETGEALLLDYMGKDKFRTENRQHLLACYKAMGRCGSSKSIAFLQEQLFSKYLLSGSTKAIHRQGAVIALMELETERSREMLSKASRSMFPSVRRAYRKAMEAGS